MDLNQKAIDLHRKFQGKLETVSKIAVTSRNELSLVYTPGVGAVCRAIAADHNLATELTMKGRTVAVVTDGSAVLGLGNIGPEAAIPVMEGKCVLFKVFGGLDAVPLCLGTQDSEEIINIVKSIAPSFAAINLEDISAPRCFEIENRLQDIGIPVMHDDQAGSAIVVLAGLINAAKVAGKKLKDLKIVINGAGAAGIAIARMLLCLSFEQGVCTPIQDLLMVDSEGIINQKRTNLNLQKQEIAKHSNHKNISGSLQDALMDADVFIGVSRPNLVTAKDVSTMAQNAIIFSMANPIPEIMPEEAKKGGALVVGSGRSDYPNQINNSLAFPGVFKGAIKAKAKRITNNMKLAAAMALASMVKYPTPQKVIPTMFDRGLAERVAEAVAKAA